ncbi:MAG TPA: hypothetical protein VNZ59_19765 [Burkholderiales bacterium]|jgi:hypothetical protein|nr:hypothetical protein [Burkholderiales bacterium]
MSTNAFNPYAAPAAPVADVSANAEADAIRRAHISHEASIKAVGFLYYLGGVGVTLVAAASLLGANDASVMVTLLLIALGVGQFFAGWAVRALRPWGRILGCVLSGLGLLGFPIGTVINAYILYLFLSKKGRTIFAPEYQAVIAATPEVKYRTSILVWIFLALLVALLAFGLLGSYFGK